MCAPTQAPTGEDPFSWGGGAQFRAGRMTVTPAVCASCGKDLSCAKQCSRCKTVYCDASCQKRHWKSGGHKGECPTIARVGLERYAADRAADRATRDACRALPAAAGASCLVCGSGEAPMVATCGRCGTAAHVRCLANRAQRTGCAPVEWYACATCNGQYPGLLFLALAREHWRSYAAAPDDDWNRVRALSVLGNALAANERDAEALPCREADLYYCQTYFADDERSVLDAQQNLAVCYSALGRHEEALVFVHMIYEATSNAYGDVAESTLRSAYNLANALGRAGQGVEEEMLLRSNHCAARKHLGRGHELTIDLGHCLAISLLDVQDSDPHRAKLRGLEAAGVLEECLRASEDVNGGDHATTRDLKSDLDDCRRTLRPTTRLFAGLTMIPA